MITFLLATSAALSSPPQWPVLFDADGWEEVATRTSDDGLEVTVSNRRLGEVDCLRGITTVDGTTVDMMMEVVADIPSALEWSSAGLTASRQLAQLEGGAIHFHQYLDIPDWTLVADRYWVLEGTPMPLEGSEGKMFRWRRVDGQALYPDLVAPYVQAGSIEPPVNWGAWTFKPDGDTITVGYRACSDVGGKLPRSIQRWVATRTLPDTVGDMVREARKRTARAGKAPTATE